MMNRITATYLIETPLAPEMAAEALAGEQSSGTFIEVPGETQELKKRFAARVEEVKLLDLVHTPSVPSKSTAPAFNRAMIKVSWGEDNFGTNLPVMISTLQGNLYELNHFTGLKLMDIQLPESFVNAFRGPAFGVEGCKALTQVFGRPLIGTIIKPSVGLTPDDTASLVKTLVDAGIDFIKDDELLSSASNSSFEVRLQKVMSVINEHADKTGKKVMYAANITGEMDEMLQRYEMICSLKGTCAIVNINSVGLTAAKKIADQGALAIHAHRNGWGMLNRHPLFGMDYRAYQMIWRMAGMDQMHVNGIDNKFWEPDEMVVDSIKSLQTQVGHQKNPLPVVSSGQWGGQAFETWRQTKTTDLLYMAGGGILAHPMGPASGVRALHQAWDSAVSGLTIDQAIKECPEFAASAKKFLK